MADPAPTSGVCDIVSDIVSTTASHRPPERGPLTLDNPATGETYTFLQRAGDTGGELLQLRWSARPGGGVGDHVHPLQEERFEILEGRLTLSIDRRETLVGPGEAVAVPPGVRHGFANRTGEAVVANLELRPALRTEQVFESLAGLAREGAARSDGLPRNPLQLAVFAADFADEIRGASPPFPIQRAIVPPLAMLARRLGYHGHYPRHRAEVAAAP